MVLLAALTLVLAGCSIQKTEPQRTGSLYVTLNSGDTLLTGARIRVDGNQTTRLTPALITGLSVGTHHIAAFRPGYVDSTFSVDVVFNATDTLALQTVPASDGSIRLDGDAAFLAGTVLLVNNIPVDTIPVSLEDPTLFPNIGIGTFEVSAYKPGYATELPSRWTVQLASGSTVTLSPVFTAVAEGPNVGDLAPSFKLRSDWGTTQYGLQDFRGQVCLVSFFFYECSACAEEFPYIASMYRDVRYAGKLQFFGIDFTDPYSRFVQYRDDHDAFGITFPLVHDPRMTVKNAYNVFNCPANYIVDPTGRIHLIQGSIPEPVLHQSVDELLRLADAPTYSFGIRDTLQSYAVDTVDFRFGGATMTNLLAASRTFLYTITPLSFVDADTGRYISLCTWHTCYQTRTGVYLQPESYSPLQVDTAVAVTVSRWVKTWVDGTPVDSIIGFHGDYTFDLSVHPSDNPREVTTYRLRLHDAAGSPLLVAEPRPGHTPAPFDHPVSR
ncbi:MAG TPA: TlpA disulfide reductase family protein [bacterium]